MCVVRYKTNMTPISVQYILVFHMTAKFSLKGASYPHFVRTYWLLLFIISSINK